MKILVVALLAISNFAFAGEQLRSEKIRAAVAEEIYTSSYKWPSNDSVGDIWVEPYTMNGDWSIEVVDWISNKHMIVNAYFSCGSEFDGSAFYGSCKVNVIKDTTEWVPVIESVHDCECEVTNF